MSSSNNATVPPVLWRARRKIGLHLRSIEEPASQLFTQTHSQQQLQQQQQQQQQQHHSNSYNIASSNRITSMELGVGMGVGVGLSGGLVDYVNEQNLLSCRNSTNTSSSSLVTATAPAPATSSTLYQYHQQQQQQQQIVLTSSSTSSKVYDVEYARMEAWMDENQEFVQDYFIRKATRQVVDAWLVSHATTAGTDICISPTHTHPNGQSCSCSRGGSGATTPVRKISAHEFERGGLLKPIVNTIDGTPTFLSINTQNDCSATNVPNSNNGGNGNNSSGGNSGTHNTISCHLCHQQHYPQHHGMVGSSNHHNHHHHNHHNHHHHNHHQHYRPQRLSRNELKQLDEKELIFELVKDICNELAVRTLCHKILQNVSILLNADRGSLFLVQGRCNGNDGPKKYLVSKLFDVCPRSTVEEMEQKDEVQITWGTGIAGHVAECGEPINIPDAYQDERFNCEIDTLTGYRTKTLLCMPIKDSAGDVIGVAQVINKLNGECFTETDEKVFASYLQFCGIGLRNAQLYEKSQLEIKRNQVLLDLARMIFEEQSTIEHMVFRILTHMQSLIQCQRVQILLVHEASKGSFSRVFDFEANDLSDEENTTLRTSPFESRFPINVGITGYVATTGETVSISNAYEDNRFDASVDENSSFKHKTILCMAIKNSLGQIIGVIQLINKFDNLDFTKNDENFVEAFAIFCGMGIHNTYMYEKAIAAMAKQSVTLEVLSYHASATIDEAHRLRRLRVPSAAHFRLHDFRFDDMHFEDDDTLRACLRMFLDLDFVERFHIDYEVLCRWLLSVKKNYRNVIYHNWRHAFNVAQMMFAILTATQWWKIFGEIECLALIIACLCHDLDHRGTNNSFQIKASSPLAQLYSTSTMEHHHFDQCLMILNSPGNQILANLSSEDYCRVIKVLEDAILSTDLAVYLRKRTKFLQNVDEQPITYWLDEDPRSLLRAMCMTVCDLSAITKPWEIEKRVADLVSSEFFEQGDMEKQELNITPIDLMNREKEDELPMMQVGFIESICLPIYEAFAKLSDKLEPLVEGVRNNRQHWLELAKEVQIKSKKSNGLMESTEESNSDDSNICLVHPPIDPHYITNDKIESYLRTQTPDCDEVETGIEADDDDSDVDSDVLPLNSCYSSHSSRLSTPPPTGEEDSSSTSPAKTTTENQAKLIAENLENLETILTPANLAIKTRSLFCRHCDCLRIRKSSSLKWANELKSLPPYRGSDYRNYSKSTPSMNNCGVTRGLQYCGRRHHHHHLNHNQHYNSSRSPNHYYCQQYHQKSNHQQHHRRHHHYYCRSNSSGGVGGYGESSNSVLGGSGLSNASSFSESDKIPKIVGKLNNLDTLHYQQQQQNQQNKQKQPHLVNGNAATNGHFNYLPANLLTSRRHSGTNGTLPVMFANSNQLKTIVSAAGGCDK